MIARIFFASLLLVSNGFAQDTIDELEKLPIWGTINVSTKSAQLTIPDDYTDAVRRGRVMLLNDTDAPIGISDVESSCGCTQVQVMAKSLKPDRKTALVVDYVGQMPGDQQVELSILFGSRQVKAFGAATTLPRLSLVDRRFQFTPQNLAVMRLKKEQPLKVKRIIARPTSIVIDSSLKQTKRFVSRSRAFRRIAHRR